MSSLRGPTTKKNMLLLDRLSYSCKYMHNYLSYLLNMAPHPPTCTRFLGALQKRHINFLSRSFCLVGGCVKITHYSCLIRQKFQEGFLVFYVTLLHEIFSLKKNCIGRFFYQLGIFWQFFWIQVSFFNTKNVTQFECIYYETSKKLNIWKKFVPCYSFIGYFYTTVKNQVQWLKCPTFWRPFAKSIKMQI